MSEDQDQPITAGEGERLFAPLLDFRHVLLAVSGGADSTALMVLAARWRAARECGPMLSVATVDHGLRAESRAEAAQVGDWAKALGLPHSILPWPGDKPRSRVQEKARQARYKLLTEHAGHIGADVIATAHHADDQAETVLMRFIRGSGPAGLAGMSATVQRGSVLHQRPLLCVAKARLVATLAAAGQPWFEDPSNQSDAYARNRLRRILQALEPEGLSRSRLTTLARRLARGEEALASAATEAYRGLARVAGESCAIAADIWDRPSEIRVRVLMAAVAEVSGRTSPLRLERVEQLEQRLGVARRQGRALDATLGGCLVFLDRAGNIAVTREGARRRGSFRQA